MKVLEHIVSKEEEMKQIRKVKKKQKKAIIRMPPNKNVVTVKFSGIKSDKLEVNYYQANKSIRHLRECAGKSNIIPTDKQLRNKIQLLQ